MKFLISITIFLILDLIAFAVVDLTSHEYITFAAGIAFGYVAKIIDNVIHENV